MSSWSTWSGWARTGCATRVAVSRTAGGEPPLARLLMQTRWRLGALLGWAQGDDGDHELRMAVLVKPNGRFGRLCTAAIAPFRHLVVHPALTRQWERAWRERAAVGA
ncbi:DUF2867 domain-containing protein [Actinokineospora fastidiosa]|uniref:DUF2867 domain-containing protein n=1 Tax=Actinokineospora fastidiosa TaxID=1816 RepID=A0A918LC89_9PSEU|nr:DUF2867 domain-containing protein [Actinokineospora fastidiosa]GGS30221.1 hypothetical protein GCM10010171_24660 [Actinokineospora fastidiosa]